jgi:hypothetical protein
MSKIFDVAGDVVDTTVDFVDDNKEILAAIALAYATGGTSTAATATAAEATAAATAAELTAAEIAAAEAARIAAIETSKQAALAETIALGKTSGEVALAGSPGFLPNTMTASQAYPELIGQIQPNALVSGSPTNIESIYPELAGQVDPSSQVVMKGASQPNIFERGFTAVKDAGTAFVNDPIGATSRAFEEYRPKTPGEYFTSALTLSAGGNVINALNQPEQGQARPRSTTNTYEGPQAPKTYVTQPATLPLPTRYDVAKQQVSRTVGTPTNVGLLAVNNSPFYDFLKTNNLNRGIL